MRGGLPCWLALLLFGWAVPATAVDATAATAAWRAAATQTRTLADNDAPRAHAQAQRLQATLPAAATQADRILALNLLSRTEIYLAQTQLAAAHARQARDQARRNGDRIGEAEAELNIALNAINAARIDAATEASSRALALLDDAGRPDLLGEALLRTAMMYRRTGHFDESVTQAMQAIDIAKRSHDPLALTYAYQGLAISFDQSHRYQEAAAHYTKMRGHARAAGSMVLEADALLGLGGVTVSRGDTRGGQRLIGMALKRYRTFGGPFYVAHGLFVLADSLRRQGRHAEGRPLLDEIFALYARHPNKIGQWWALNARSANDAALGKAAAARSAAEQAWALAREIDLPLYQAESAGRLAALHAAAGDHRRAYRYAAEAAEMTARATRDRTGERMVLLAQRYQSESKQREIDELTRRNVLQAAGLRQNELDKRWLATVLGGSCAMLLGGALFFRRLLRSKREIRALNAGLEQRVQDRTAELRQQTRYLRTLIDTLPLAIWLKDTHNRFLALNRATAERYGQTPDAMTGKSELDLLPLEAAKLSRDHDLVVLTSRRQMIVEEQLADPRGTRWLEICKAPVVDEDGSVLGSVGYAHDISAHKEAEAAREAALAEAKQLAQMRSEFMARISHELRTPLNGILGYAQLLQQDGAMNEQQMARLNIIERSGDHLLALINHILDHVGRDADTLELRRGDIRLDTSVAVVPCGAADNPPAAAALPAPPCVPPAAELDALHKLARRGNMRSIARHADRLAQLGEAYRPFAELLRRLAADYQSQAILGLVERQREARGEV